MRTEATGEKVGHFDLGSTSYSNGQWEKEKHVSYEKILRSVTLKILKPNVMQKGYWFTSWLLYHTNLSEMLKVMEHSNPNQLSNNNKRQGVCLLYSNN